MTVLDSDLITAVQAPLVEDALFSSGLWTQAEVLGYLVQRQNRFLRETLCLTAIATIPITPGTADITLPPDWVSTVCVLYHDLVADVWEPLEATDAWEADHLLGSQTAGTTPIAYRDADVTESLTLTLFPTPQGAGELELLYVSLAEPLDGTGLVVDVPDDWARTTLKYGMLADMLAKEGRGQDLARARYCEMRYAEGVTLARALLEGWA